MSQEKLFAEFPPVTTAEWEEVIKADLKGADYEKKLIWKTIEGINVKPYYRAEDLQNLSHLNSNPGEYPFVRGIKAKSNDWEVRQDIEIDNCYEANKLALEAIERGATSLGFKVKNLQTHEEMTAMFQGIDLTKIKINFTLADSYPLVYDYYMYELNKQNIDPSKAKGSFNFDSLAYLLINGDFYISKENNFVEAAGVINRVMKSGLDFRVINVNGHIYHNSGATAVQELAFALAAGNEYLVELTNKGLAVEDIAKHMQFTFAVGSNYFMEIAKLRAARMLWAKIVEQYNPATKGTGKMFIHCNTSKWNKTVYDPNVNMLRVTTEAMAAVLGGCNSLNVDPYDATYKDSDPMSRRIARNTQIIIKEESYFDKIVDPAAGSYYIESLTASIATEAWKLFIKIAEKGGFVEAAKQGYIQDEIAKTAQQRDMAIATRKDTLLGTNQYPNNKERMKAKVTLKKEEAKVKDTFKRLTPYRGAMAFEELRFTTEKMSKTPVVFLYTYGNLAMRKARGMFSSNFFGCAGFEIVDTNGFASVEEGIKAAQAAKADIVVLCSSDDDYMETAVQTAQEFNAKMPKALLVVAGNPTEILEPLRQAGVDDFIHVRTNVLESLKEFQRRLLK